jgi:alanyl-tRNA synthetase
MGLDRTLAVLNGQKSVYDTELFKPLFDVLALDQEILSNHEVKKARIILDHIRAAVFIVSDGVEPSNKDRGYVLRRLLRRAMVMGRMLNLKLHWLKALVGQVIFTYTGAYVELTEKSQTIFEVIEGEQKKFEATLEKGLKEFNRLVEKGKEKSKNAIAHVGLPGEAVDKSEYIINALDPKDAFDLYQTYGFPFELINELLSVYALYVDKDEFEKKFKEYQKQHQELSRTASAGQFKGGLASHSDKIVRLHTATHLMNAALRIVLGKDVWQKGSNITEERTRFDFTHNQKMTEEQKKQVEDLVNGWVQRDLTVKKEIMPYEEARKLEAIGVFGEKYAETVSVYTVFDPTTNEIISREFCGGPHVEHTGVIGKFKIQKEEASSAGVRRIKATVD